MIGTQPRHDTFPWLPLTRDTPTLSFSNHGWNHVHPVRYPGFAIQLQGGNPMGHGRCISYGKDRTGKWTALVWVPSPQRKELNVIKSTVVPASSDHTHPCNFQHKHQKCQLEGGTETGTQGCHGSGQRHSVRVRTSCM